MKFGFFVFTSVIFVSFLSSNQFVSVLIRNGCEDWDDVLSQHCSNQVLLQVSVELSQDLQAVAFMIFHFFGISILLCSCGGRLGVGLDEQLVEWG